MHQAFLLTGKKSERTLAKEEKEKADKLAKARENKFECKCGSFYPQTQREKILPRKYSKACEMAIKDGKSMNMGRHFENR
jgi:hypothetical protein